MKLKEIAARISAHLKAWEKDPTINTISKGGMATRRFYNAGASSGGSRVFVCYVSYQGPSSLTKTEALDYLAWLDAGNVGSHFEFEREAKKA